MTHDYLVVGAGLFGSVFAHEMRKRGRSVLVIDKRHHIGGNCHTERRDGIDVHVYGPHIFHTSDDRIWRYVKQFSDFNSYVNRPKVRRGDRLYSFPINLFTLYQVWGVTTPEEARRKLAEVAVPIDRPRNMEEWALSQVGRELYDTFIYGYTKKQWMREPRDLPASILKRLPIRLTHDDNYFNDTHQGIPVDGYDAIFEGLLDGCDVELGVDFFAHRSSYEARARRIVYTGRVDEYFGYCRGDLDYRTLSFEHFTGTGDHQGCAIVNYADESVPWTRVTEHKHFTPERRVDATVWTRETPVPWERSAVPYYPIDDAVNRATYAAYEELKARESHVVFGGRLADYRYYDMHQVIGAALARAAAEP